MFEVLRSVSKIFRMWVMSH